MTIETIVQNIQLALIWILDGFLGLVYLILENLLVVVLIPSLAWLVVSIPKPQKRWMLAVALMAITAALFGPTVVRVWMIVMAAGSLVALNLEMFNPGMLSWRILSGIGLYALIGLGSLLYQLLAVVIADSSGVFLQGQSYLDIVIGIAVFLGPLGFLGLLAQAIFAHPPLQGTPEEIVTTVRTRGRR